MQLTSTQHHPFSVIEAPVARGESDDVGFPGRIAQGIAAGGGLGAIVGGLGSQLSVTAVQRFGSDRVILEVGARGLAIGAAVGGLLAVYGGVMSLFQQPSAGES